MIGIGIFLIWLACALPGLPISLPVLHYLFKDDRNQHAGSAALGVAMMVTSVIGLVVWVIIGAFVLGRHFPV